MAAFFTLKQLHERLGGEVNADIDFIGALNQLGEFAYSLGRWAGSSKQFKVLAADIYQNADSGGEFEDDWFLDIDATLYDGAIRFLSKGRGYPVKSIGEDFADQPRGWGGFIDHGYKVDSAGADEKRVYKCPTSITSTDNVRCFAKKRWIDLYDDADKYPIRSISAIRYGLLAMGHHNENEMNKGNEMLALFERTLTGDSFQFDGPKKASLSFSGHYNHRPRSFR
jgi:hypothetical protein